MPRLAKNAANAIRAAIRLAGGREVCFVGTVDDEGAVVSARVVARGGVASVLALPGFAQRGEMLLHNHPSGHLEPSQPDMEIAARLHDDGIGFGIVNNDATEFYVVVEVPRRETLVELDPEAVDHDLGPDGPIAAAHGAYEDRPSQRAMALAVARLYNDGGVGLLEAGTGVGKSLGYLVPALRWAAANKLRTVVSTNTINLQEQLVGKDLPFLARALDDQPVRFALLKGWSNYLCLMRLEQARASGTGLFEDGMQRELDAIDGWSRSTADGSLSDLPAMPRSEVWDEVQAEPDVCQRQQCPHWERCFVFKARREAAQADVIVVNHHLLLSDVAVRRATQNWAEAAVLPAYDRLVLDEGHHLEGAAASHLGSSTSRRALTRLLNRLDRRGRGLLPALLQKLAASNDLLSAASFELVHSRLVPAVETARQKSAILLELLDGVLRESEQPMLRLTHDFVEHPVWRAGLRTALEDTTGSLGFIGDNLRLVRERIEGSSQLDESVGPLLNEVRAVARRLEYAGDALNLALDPPPNANLVRWLEARGKEKAIAVTAVPLDLAPILREDLFRRLKTTVVTSATLTADGRFAFLRDRLGLNDDVLEPMTAMFPSPFRFDEQAILVVPTDLPAPNAAPAEHLDAVGHIAGDLAERCDGGMFVLCTSHRDVRGLAASLRGRGADRRWPVLVHGEDARDALLARFRDSGRAILVGTASFWEGVDVPGDALRALLIVKLPFLVPSEPMTAAQCEAIQARGGDPFMEYMLPHAGLRLKQGFGRLIRTATDRGVVVLADPRVTTKAYGRDLLNGLPPARRIIAPWGAALSEIDSFLESYKPHTREPLLPCPPARSFA